MAKIEKIVDDIDGSDGAETRTYALDGATYEIDLTDKNYAKLKKALEPFLDKSRKASGPRRVKTATGKSDASEIRAWAQSNGHAVPDRGRIPKDVREAFEAANK